MRRENSAKGRLRLGSAVSSAACFRICATDFKDLQAVPAFSVPTDVPPYVLVYTCGAYVTSLSLYTLVHAYLLYNPIHTYIHTYIYIKYIYIHRICI